MDSASSTDPQWLEAIQHPESYMLCEGCLALLPQKMPVSQGAVPPELINLLTQIAKKDGFWEEAQENLELLGHSEPTLRPILLCPHCQGYKFEKNPQILTDTLQSPHYLHQQRLSELDWL